MRIQNLLIFLLSLACGQAYTQSLQVGVYADVTVAVHSFSGTPQGFCYSHKYEFSLKHAVPAGLQFYLHIDSIRGETGSVSVKRISNIATAIEDGDVITLNDAVFTNPVHFFFDGADTIYTSLKLSGTPILSNQPYRCLYTLSNGITADGCSQPFTAFTTADENCHVLGGTIVPIGPDCANAALLVPGMNWFGVDAASETANIPECWLSNPAAGSVKTSWYQFTTPATPFTLNLHSAELYGNDSIWIGGLQSALYTACGSAPVVCWGGEEWSEFAYYKVCGELEPNTTYYLVVGTYPYSAPDLPNGVSRIYLDMSPTCPDGGCMDPAACNYLPSATSDNGSCVYSADCSAQFALQVDTISCSYFHLQPPFPAFGGYWAINGYALPDWVNLEWYSHEMPGTNEICYYAVGIDGSFIGACSDITIDESCFDSCVISHSVESSANDCEYTVTLVTHPGVVESDISWQFSSGIVSGSGNDVTVTFPANGEYLYWFNVNSPMCQSYGMLDTMVVSNCTGELIPGCTDPLAANYNPLANVNDGSCVYFNPCDFELYAVADTANTNNLFIISTLNLANAAYVFWSFGDGNSSEEPYPQYAYTEDGPFLLCVSVSVDSSSFACEGEACILVDASMVEGSGFGSGFTIWVMQGLPLSATALHPTQQPFEIWPNPAVSQLNLRTAEVGTLRIVDITGREITSNAIQAGDGSISIDALSPGMYIIEFSSAYSREVKRFVKK